MIGIVPKEYDETMVKLREIAQSLADESGEVQLLLEYGDPKEEYPWKSPYVTSLSQANKWEKENVKDENKFIPRSKR